MELINLGVFLIYLLFLVLFTVFASLNWYRLKYAQEREPQTAFSAIFAVNFLSVYLFFNFGWATHIMTALVIMAAQLFGSRLQLAGLTGKFSYTGGIACGKSTVSNLFRAIEDIGVIDADEISREVME
jgi:hypothetical protein